MKTRDTLSARLTRRILREIYEAPDTSKSANEYKVNLGAESLDRKTLDIISELIRNYEILEKLEKIKALQNDLDDKIRSIKDKALPISVAIYNGDYGTRVGCCPTYWTLVKRFV